VEPLNCVAYGHVLIERVSEEVERMLTAINVNRVFTQPLTLVLPRFIEAARTPLLNTFIIILKLSQSKTSLYVFFTNFNKVQVNIAVTFNTAIQINQFVNEIIINMTLLLHICILSLKDTALTAMTDRTVLQ